MYFCYCVLMFEVHTFSGKDLIYCYICFCVFGVGILQVVVFWVVSPCNYVGGF
jgi:hypothetical protein